MEAPAGLLRPRGGLNGRRPTLWQFFCDKDGIWFFCAYRSNSQQKLFFMLSQLKGMAFILVFSFIKLSLLVIRGFGTDIVDLNSTNMNLNSCNRVVWFTVVDFANNKTSTSLYYSIAYFHLQTLRCKLPEQVGLQLRPQTLPCICAARSRLLW